MAFKCCYPIFWESSGAILSDHPATTEGALMEAIVAQYRNAQTRLPRREGKLTGPSSIMPQKRNPDGLGEVRDALVVNRQRAPAEVGADYSTTTELADVLQLDRDVAPPDRSPFRLGPRDRRTRPPAGAQGHRVHPGAAHRCRRHEVGWGGRRPRCR